MGKHKSFITTKRSKSEIKTITKTVEIPLRKQGEDPFKYYLRLKKMGLPLPRNTEGQNKKI